MAGRETPKLLTWKSAIIRLVVFFPLVFGTFHLFIFYCWYLRGFAIEIPFLAGPLVLLAMGLRLRRFIPMPPHPSETPFAPLASASSLLEIAAWYVAMAGLYVLLWTCFDFPHSLEGESWRPVVLGYGLYFAGVVVVGLLVGLSRVSIEVIYRDLRRASRVISRILSVLFMYLVVDLVFAFAFRVASLVHPGSFDRPLAGFVDAFYYSTATITTLGYGEIHPTCNATKVMASVEALLGVVLLAALMATAIAIAIREEPRDKNSKRA